MRYLVCRSHLVHLGHSCSSFRRQRRQRNHGKRQEAWLHLRQYISSDIVPEAKHLTAEVKDLIKRILVPSDKRLTIDEILHHPWMTKPLPENKLRLDFSKMRNFAKFTKVVFPFYSVQNDDNDLHRNSVTLKRDPSLRTTLRTDRYQLGWLPDCRRVTGGSWEAKWEY